MTVRRKAVTATGTTPASCTPEPIPSGKPDGPNIAATGDAAVPATKAGGRRPATRRQKQTSPKSDAPSAVDDAPSKPQPIDEVPETLAEPSVPEAPPPTQGDRVDLKAPEYYLNRELTWLAFNHRVLNEAQDARNPLLERVKFLAIANSNLDEFFMKRVGGLKQQIAAAVHQLSVDGRTPQQQISECAQAVKEMQVDIRRIYMDLVASLQKKGIAIARYNQLSDAERESVRRQYLANILPLVTPLAMDPAHPFPFISNLSLNLLVTLRYRDEEEPLMNRIKVPLGSGVPRFLEIDGSKRFVPLEEVMAHNLDLLFPEMEVVSCEVFRVTRNANTELDEDQAEDLLSMIETELRYRKFAPFVRLEIDQNMDPYRCGMLAAELGLDESADVFDSDVPLGMSDIMQLVGIDAPELHDPDHHPITNTRLQESRNIFHLIRDSGSILLSVPYESFATSVERFVREASLDPRSGRASS